MAHVSGKSLYLHFLSEVLSTDDRFSQTLEANALALVQSVEAARKRIVNAESDVRELAEKLGVSRLDYTPADPIGAMVEAWSNQVEALNTFWNEGVCDMEQLGASLLEPEWASGLVRQEALAQGAVKKMEASSAEFPARWRDTLGKGSTALAKWEVQESADAHRRAQEVLAQVERDWRQLREQPALTLAELHKFWTSPVHKKLAEAVSEAERECQSLCEKARLQREREEQERKERERQERERIQQEKEEHERKERERIEREQQQRHREEVKRKEQERREREAREAREREAKEKLERERQLEERLEHERKELERFALERAQRELEEIEREERERLEREQQLRHREEVRRKELEREKQRKERKEREEREEQARIERERLQRERLERERLEREALELAAREQEERERLERERLAKEEADRLALASRKKRNQGLFVALCLVAGFWIGYQTSSDDDSDGSQDAADARGGSQAVADASMPPNPVWLEEGLYGHDNKAAALMPVRISESGNGKYFVQITNQFGFSCRIDFDAQGNPARLVGCRSTTDPQWTASPRVISLRCDKLATEVVCRGTYELKAGNDTVFTTDMVIARQL